MDKIRVAVIYGSTRPGRFCHTVVGWTVERLAASDKFQLDVIDPADPPQGRLLMNALRSPCSSGWARQTPL